jgi:4-amino-4-deoxy-L-arabinose transferase-like glycosyltransferase
MLSNSAVLSFLQNFSDNPNLDSLVPTFQRTLWHFVLLFSVGIVLCFWKVDSKVSNCDEKVILALTNIVKLLFLAIIVGGVIVRLQLLFLPITYDEAFTYNQYVSQPLSAVLSSYTYPNNQIFHTILAKLSTQIFGISHWALRLPSFLFSLGSIILAFQIGRSTNIKLALMFSFILAFMPIFIDYGALARGYSIVLFLGLLLWKTSIDWQLNNRQERVGGASQLQFIGIGAIAIWTIPVAILPVAIVLLKLRAAISSRLIIKLGLCTGLVSLFLYAPVILLFGWEEIGGYPGMPQASFEMLFSHHIWHGLKHLYYVFIMEKEVLLLFVLLAFYAVVRKLSILKEFIPIAIVIIGFVISTRVDPPARVWLIIMPFIYFPIVHFYATQVIQQKSNLVAIAFIVVFSATAILTLQVIQLSVMRDFRMVAEKEAVRWMQENIPKERLQADFPSDAGILWYQSLYELPIQNQEGTSYTFRLKIDNKAIQGKVVQETADYFLLEITDFESIKN